MEGRLTNAEAEGTKERLVWDMTSSGLNEHLRQFRFAYADYPAHLARMVASGARFMGQLDYSSFYHSLRLAKDMWLWAGYRDRDGNGWVFTRIPFGIRVGCVFASAVSAEARGAMKAKCGTGPFFYLDDGQVFHARAEGCGRALLLAVVTSVAGGLQLQPRKLQLPARVQEFLGRNIRLAAAATSSTLRDGRWNRLCTSIDTCMTMGKLRLSAASGLGVRAW